MTARRLAWLITALLAVLVLSACSRSTKTTQPAVARRVVSLSPSTTETMFAIGAGASLVGRSRYCDYPKEALALPQVGGYVDPSFEAILALRPDLVIGARGPAGPKLAETLASHGVATYFPETESIVQIDAMIRGVGALVGHAELAEHEVARLDARLAEIAAVAARQPEPKKRVLLVYGLDPIVAAGPGSFADELIGRAGGVNVVREGQAYPTLGMERVLALDPDLILDATTMESHATTRIAADAPGWRELRAVRAGCVSRLTNEATLRPGPRVDEGLAAIAAGIRPHILDQERD